MTYTDVSALLLSLRREHPKAEVVTEHVRIEDGFAVFKATISIPDGGKATGHGSEYNGDAIDYVEEAETKAIARALTALGYGSQVAESRPAVASDEEAIAVAPTSSQERTPRSHVRPVVAESDEMDEPADLVPIRTDDQTPAAASPTPMPNRERPDRRQPSSSSRSAPVEIGTARERPASTSPTPFPSQSTASPASQRASRSSAGGASAAATASADAGDQPPLEDYSWTAFWKWAREQGYESKGGIEAFIGRQMNNLSPAEVRQLIVAKRGGS
jgi:hypothetical protein